MEVVTKIVSSEAFAAGTRVGNEHGCLKGCEFGMGPPAYKTSRNPLHLTLTTHRTHRGKRQTDRNSSKLRSLSRHLSCH
eukprot:2838814-Rhodomonas_salina.2